MLAAAFSTFLIIFLTYVIARFAFFLTVDTRYRHLMQETLRVAQGIPNLWTYEPGTPEYKAAFNQLHTQFEEIAKQQRINLNDGTVAMLSNGNNSASAVKLGFLTPGSGCMTVDGVNLCNSQDPSIASGGGSVVVGPVPDSFSAASSDSSRTAYQNRLRNHPTEVVLCYDPNFLAVDKRCVRAAGYPRLIQSEHIAMSIPVTTIAPTTVPTTTVAPTTTTISGGSSTTTSVGSTTVTGSVTTTTVVATTTVQGPCPPGSVVFMNVSYSGCTNGSCTQQSGTGLIAPCYGSLPKSCQLQDGTPIVCQGVYMLRENCSQWCAGGLWTCGLFSPGPGTCANYSITYSPATTTTTAIPVTQSYACVPGACPQGSNGSVGICHLFENGVNMGLSADANCNSGAGCANTCQTCMFSVTNMQGVDYFEIASKPDAASMGLVTFSSVVSQYKDAIQSISGAGDPHSCLAAKAAQFGCKQGTPCEAGHDGFIHCLFDDACLQAEIDAQVRPEDKTFRINAANHLRASYANSTDAVADINALNFCGQLQPGVDYTLWSSCNEFALLDDQAFADLFAVGLGTREVFLDEDCNVLSNTDNRVLCGYYMMTASPISLLWDGGRILSNEGELIRFPLGLKGDPRDWSIWFGSKETPLLVYDPKHEGKITFAEQLFGNHTFGGKVVSDSKGAAGKKKVPWNDGYEALGSLDRNADGKVSGTELADLALWFDRNKDGVSDAGEVISVNDVGLKALFYKNTRKDVETGHIYADQGFERIVNGKVVEGTSVDWYAKTFTSKGEAARSLSSLQTIDADGRGIKPHTGVVDEHKGADSNGEGDVSFWVWTVAEKGGAINPGFFKIVDNGGKLTGWSMFSVPLAKNDAKLREAVVYNKLEGTKKPIGKSGAYTLEFTVKNADGKSIATNKTLLLPGGKVMEGRTQQQNKVKDSGETVSLSYSWNAYRISGDGNRLGNKGRASVGTNSEMARTGLVK